MVLRRDAQKQQRIGTRLSCQSRRKPVTAANVSTIIRGASGGRTSELTISHVRPGELNEPLRGNGCLIASVRKRLIDGSTSCSSTATSTMHDRDHTRRQIKWLVDHQHHFGGLDDRGHLAPHLNVELLDALLCNDAFDQVLTHSNAHFRRDDSEVHRFDRASQLIAC